MARRNDAGGNCDADHHRRDESNRQRIARARLHEQPLQQPANAEGSRDADGPAALCL